MPTVLGTLLIVVAPHFIGNVLPPTLPFISASAACLIGYAIFRYKVFELEPAALSDTVLGTMNESVLAINSYGEIEHINPTAVRMLGLKSQSALGQTLDTVFNPDTAKLIGKKIASGNTDAIELDIITPAGTIPISLIASGIKGDQGSTAGNILVFRDITREHAAKAEVEQLVVERTQEVREEQAKLRASIDGLALGFVLIDRQDKIVIQNKMLQNIFGPDKAVTNILELDNVLEGYDLAAACKTIKKTGEAEAAVEVSLGAKILHLQLSPVKIVENGKDSVIGFVLLVEDITEAKVQTRSRDEFFSIASHELRTPLTAIMGNASMIIDYHPDVLKDPEMKEMIYDIHDATEQLIGIVGDFMDVSGLEQGKVVFKPEEFMLGPVVETVVYEMRTILEAKHLSVSVEPKTLGTLPAIWADKGRTKQVLYNLVGNALKFTEKGGASIHISTEGDAMKIVVSDTGRGISVVNQKLLFHKLQQAGSSLLTRDTTRGTGLGLYISKILVERMGGTITLDRSVPKKGSSFSVTLPLATAPRKQAADVEPATHTDASTGLSV
jgi:PAS domain S-box-containing protein